MTAVEDYIRGRCPQIDPGLAREVGIGVDRTWRVGLVLLTHLNNAERRAYPSEKRLARLSRCDVSSVKKALKVLQLSGVIDEVESPVRCRAWRNAWVPSRRSVGRKITVRTVSFNTPEVMGVSDDKVFRVMFQLRRQPHTTAQHISLRTGVSVRSVRAVLRGLDRKVKSSRSYRSTGETIRKRRPAVRHCTLTMPLLDNVPAPPIEPSGGGKPPHSETTTTYVSVGDSACHSRRALRTGRPDRGGPVPYEVFGSSYSPDEENMPSGLLKRHQRMYQKAERKAKREEGRRSRNSTPPQEWTPTMVAREFVDQYSVQAPMHRPQDLIPVHKLAMILSRMASEAPLITPEHMVRSIAGFFSSHLFVTKMDVPAWRKFLWVVREVEVDENEWSRAMASEDHRRRLRELPKGNSPAKPLPLLEDVRRAKEEEHTSGEYQRRREIVQEQRRLAKLKLKIQEIVREESRRPGSASRLLGEDWEAIIGQWRKEVRDGLQQGGDS